MSSAFLEKHKNKELRVNYNKERSTFFIQLQIGNNEKIIMALSKESALKLVGYIINSLTGETEEERKAPQKAMRKPVKRERTEEEEEVREVRQERKPEEKKVEEKKEENKEENENPVDLKGGIEPE